jgi:transcriptional regulator with XRE-family HTH domain
VTEVPEAAWFGGRLRELREAAGLTQPQLAERVGISTRQVSRLETGEQVATWPTVLALAKALGVDCTAFTTPPAAEAAATRPRGRPRRAAGAEGAELEPGADVAPSETPPPGPEGKAKGKRRKRKGGEG